MSAPPAKQAGGLAGDRITEPETSSAPSVSEGGRSVGDQATPTGQLAEGGVRGGPGDRQGTFRGSAIRLHAMAHLGFCAITRHATAPRAILHRVARPDLSCPLCVVATSRRVVTSRLVAISCVVCRCCVCAGHDGACGARSEQRHAAPPSRNQKQPGRPFAGQSLCSCMCVPCVCTVWCCSRHSLLGSCASHATVDFPYYGFICTCNSRCAKYMYSMLQYVLCVMRLQFSCTRLLDYCTVWMSLGHPV